MGFKTGVGIFLDRISKSVRSFTDAIGLTKKNFDRFAELFQNKKAGPHLTQIYRKAVRRRINTFNINVTKRMEDIIDGYRVNVFTLPNGGHYYKVSHAFEKNDPKYTVTATQCGRTKTNWSHTYYGSTIFKALDTGRKAYQIPKDSSKVMWWGYPYPENPATSKKTIMVQPGDIFKEGVGMTIAGNNRMEAYFRQQVVTITKASKSL